MGGGALEGVMLAALLLLGLLPLAVLPMTGGEASDDDDDISLLRDETEADQTTEDRSSILDEAMFDVAVLDESSLDGGGFSEPVFYEDQTLDESDMPQILPDLDSGDTQESVVHSLDASPGVTYTTLGPTDDVLNLADDGIMGTGAGTIEMRQARPMISSEAGIEVVDAGAGDDQITTGDSAAFVFGNEGDDTLTAGEGATALYGGEGQDVLQAGETGQYLDGGTGNDQILGGSGDDTLEGGEHSDVISAGDDTINGGAGDDAIRGGYGADLLIGGEGDDVIDHLGRTEQREVITRHEFAWHTDGDADTLDGGYGDDMLIFDRSDGATGGAGNDVFWLWHDGSDGCDIAEVTDFVVGEDFLRVSLNPHIGENGEPDILVEPSMDGNDGMVFVNGDLVAILRGAPTATVSDVYAEVHPDVFQ